MEKLTKAEEEIMQLIWDLEKCLVKDIIIKLGNPDIPHSTVSSVVRILEKKGFVSHKAYGRTHEYFPLISKEEYAQHELNGIVSKYFESSPASLVSYLVKEENIKLSELSSLIEKLKKSDHDKS